MTTLLSDYDYELPAELIAQHPPTERDGARLMLLNRGTGAVSHHQIRDLPQLLPAEALLVVNDTKVVPARLQARRVTGGRVEVMLLEPLDDGIWLAMVRASKRPRAGECLLVGAEGDDAEKIELVRPRGQGRFEVRLPGEAFIEQHGHVPLPPYIRRDPVPADRQRYQTVYANPPGSVAAPTAGLHLSERVLAELAAAGIARTALTLHVGPGTFTPVRSDDVDQHEMESERVIVSAGAAADIQRARAEQRRVVAVGTTCVRALEATGARPSELRTDLFIRPGHQFAIVEGLLTNFHLPRSTLLMLVAAFAGRDQVLAAYREAVQERYRFYSYGDAMLIL